MTGPGHGVPRGEGCGCDARPSRPHPRVLSGRLVGIGWPLADRIDLDRIAQTTLGQAEPEQRTAMAAGASAGRHGVP
ncbi:hypothetical protein GCM10007977_076390 [Dactylosporangium sucinum]|uniref:Uncharacterized protein n=1 Tax=Dactylosporangium sucinum TaxID=1424081 RepID=A0A917X2X2_9ACTN|nr:hypothetical protein GCM10007977_076390 [Dactylosporangium sucinum]